jgi:hypothetical protein
MALVNDKFILVCLLYVSCTYDNWLEAMTVKPCWYNLRSCFDHAAYGLISTVGIVGALWLVRLSRTPGESLIIDNIKQISIQNITKPYSKIKTSWTPACFFCWALGPRWRTMSSSRVPWPRWSRFDSLWLLTARPSGAKAPQIWMENRGVDQNWPDLSSINHRFIQNFKFGLYFLDFWKHAVPCR